MKKSIQILILLITIVFNSFAQNENLQKIHTIKGKHSYINEIYISQSEKYLVILSEYKYITFYNFATWQIINDYKSNKFISIEGCGFIDSDKYFFAKYGSSFQHRQKITIDGWSTNIKNYAPKTDFHEDRFNAFKKFKQFEYNNYVFKINGNSIDIYTKKAKMDNPNIIVADNLPPEIIITNPNVTRGFKPVSTNKEIIISGVVTDENGVYKVLINGEEINMQNNGAFSHTALLAMGDNSFTVTATDTKRNTTTKQFIIERNSNQQETQVVNNQTNNTNVLQTGKYYALIIGNNSYQDNAISSLNEPINDATKLYNVLTTQYTFEPQNVTLLKNATYVQMIEAFDYLSNTLTENDNLLVFYASHGWWDDDKNLGYWLPTDARKNSTAFWIANSRISDYMSSIKSKHTLLIADACFSGSIFKTRSAFADAQPAINKLYELPSKTAMTSGNLKEVPDKSVFLQYLVKRLNDNTEKYISADQLFASFRIAVMNNSTTEPQFGTIQNAGDEGGEFIFIRRK